jgi:radical SAM superfamily enzyme YgiQ (UPF0313 family)
MGYSMAPDSHFIVRAPVLLISAGLLTPKKGDHVFARKHRYLNYGLLTIGTILYELGHNVRLLHGGFLCPEKLAQSLLNEGSIGPNYPIFLSLPSNYAIPWARRFTATIKGACPQAKIIIGGRWVVADDGPWIRQRVPGTDLVVYGTAEGRANDLLFPERWPALTQTDLSRFPGPPDEWKGPIELRYDLSDDFASFHPSIEVSRGCGMGCSFCEERNVKLTTLRSPDSLIAAMKGAIAIYGVSDVRFYLEASWFVPREDWAETLAMRYTEAGLTNRWRCETRVDSLQPRTLNHLARSGLKVLDLGLESASVKQLGAMKKTSRPAAYLERASALLSQCRDLGIWTKVNVMLYAGETDETLAETMEWLAKHKSKITGVSVGAVMVYGHGSGARDYLTELQTLGAKCVDPDSVDRDGYAHLHLSKEIDYDRAKALSIQIAQEYMTDRNYYDLKAFSYLPRDYLYGDFVADLDGLRTDALPFRVTV